MAFAGRDKSAEAADHHAGAQQAQRLRDGRRFAACDGGRLNAHVLPCLDHQPRLAVHALELLLVGRDQKQKDI